MKTRFLPILIMLCFGIGACGTPESDLQEFCNIVETIMADDEKKNKDIAIGKAVSMNMKTEEVKELMDKLLKTPAKKRYKTLKKGAKKLGLKGYKCKAAKKWFKLGIKKKKK